MIYSFFFWINNPIAAFTNISTSGVYSGGTFYYYHYNNIAKALGLPTVSSKEECTAALFNALRTAYYKQAGLS